MFYRMFQLIAISLGLTFLLLSNGCSSGSQQHMVQPAFTDLGVGSLITNARMKMTQEAFNALITSVITPVITGTSNTFLAPPPDVCLPPTHGGWASSTPAALPWGGVSSGISMTWQNTNPSWRDAFIAALTEFWGKNRGTGASPIPVLCEIEGLTAPDFVESTSGMHYTGVTVIGVPNQTTPTTVRIILLYKPGPAQ